MSYTNEAAVTSSWPTTLETSRAQFHAVLATHRGETKTSARAMDSSSLPRETSRRTTRVVMMDGDGGGGGYDEDGRPDVSGRRGKNDGICTIIWGGGWGAWHALYQYHEQPLSVVRTGGTNPPHLLAVRERVSQIYMGIAARPWGLVDDQKKRARNNTPPKTGCEAGSAAVQCLGGSSSSLFVVLAVVAAATFTTIAAGTRDQSVVLT
ncbi:hypothetical protein DFH94DRAFT_680482 [Russula ochroleuca]|uniref:Uncharacterized protein n=1 Tax=Russula ochroleuca TaxID=152965 RepID=A0A9P5MZC2_9AGAM|nr:hypothetical protein DFH94DRAFT_680482 [Russula ochroleuca]